jgi:molybdate transport system ATP-binding protein
MSVLKANIVLRRPGFVLKLNCEINKQVTGIFGSSGAGKTTFLQSLAGLQIPDSGSISIAGREVFNAEENLNLAPEKRKIGFVFQEGRLFPHLTVIQNLRYGIRDKSDIYFFQEVTELLKITDILSSKVSNISGGQAQRVAIGRALLTRPDILVLDEPFSALDKKLRHHIIALLKPLISKFNLPVLVISHDLSDLLMLSDNLLIIEKGQCVGHGDYYDLIAANDSRSALTSAGLVNAIDLKIETIDHTKGLMNLSHENQQIFAESWLNEERFLDDDHVHVVLRPEDITLASHKIRDISMQNQLEGKIEKLIATKNKVFCVVDCGFKLISEVSLATQQKMKLEVGKSIWCLFKAAAVKLNSPGFLNSTDL